MLWSAWRGAVCVAGLFALAACGGGGGGGAGASSGGGGGVSPPPNTPPVVVVAAPTDVYEGRPFALDARQSSDPGGTIHTLTWRQTSGPTAALQSELLYYYAFRAPQIAGAAGATEEMTFEVSAADYDGAVTTQTIHVIVHGFHDGPGTPVGIYDPPLNLIGNAEGYDILASRVRNGQVELVTIGHGTQGTDIDYGDSSYTLIDGHFADPSVFQWRSLIPNGLGLAEQFTALSEADDAFRFFNFDEGALPARRMIETDRFTITDPCFVAGDVYFQDSNFWVGQRDGLSLMRQTPIVQSDGRVLSFDETVVGRLQDGRALCFLYPTTMNVYSGPTNATGYPALIALDYDTNEIVILRDNGGPSVYEDYATIPLETQSTHPLRIVAAFGRGGYSTVPRYIVVLLTDDQEVGGEHRLIIIHQDSDAPQLRQEVFAWSNGVPTGVAELPYGGMSPGDAYRADLVVVTSNGALVFDNIANPNTGSGEPPAFTTPWTFDLGGRPGSVVAALKEEQPGIGILVSFPETGELRFFPPPQN